MIAARRAEKKRLEKMIQAVLLVVAGELLITFAVFAIMTTQVFRTGGEIKQIDRELAKIQPTVDQIRAYESDIKQLEPRLKLLEDSKQETLLWYTVLQDLGRSMPESTWLNSLVTAQPTNTASTMNTDKKTAKPGPTLNLRGTTVSQRLVGETMLRLNQCPEFERVDLAYTQESAGANFTGVEFQITAILKSTEQGKGGT